MERAFIIHLSICKAAPSIGAPLSLDQLTSCNRFMRAAMMMPLSLRGDCFRPGCWLHCHFPGRGPCHIIICATDFGFGYLWVSGWDNGVFSLCIFSFADLFLLLLFFFAFSKGFPFGVWFVLCATNRFNGLAYIGKSQNLLWPLTSAQSQRRWVELS